MRIGHYIVRGRLGSGGSGVVYDAEDERLRRKVAIKALLPAGGGDDDTAGQARLLREARAMAKLNHPNVVHVYEVIERDTEIYVVMEKVEGETLRAWRKRSARSWREVVDVMQRVGRGLAAIHQAGLVHRDFKPDNVVIGDDGVPRVIDLGLARAGHIEDAAFDPAQSSDDIVTADEEIVTRHGTVIGTPLYMAPEQHDGRVGDERCDIYAFALSFLEVLHGRRPWSGPDGRARRADLPGLKVSGRPPFASGSDGVPRWLDRQLAAALAPLAEARPLAITDLLDTLARRRRRPRLVAGGIVTAGVLAGSVALGATFGPTAAQCPDATSLMGESWNAAARTRVESSLFAAEGPAPQRVAAEAIRRLDVHAERWIDAMQEVCVARREGRLSELEVAASRACLAERRMELQEVATVLEQADPTAAASAVMVTDTLRPPAACIAYAEDPRESSLEASPESTRAIAEIRRIISRAEAWARAGDLDRARTEAQNVDGRIDALAETIPEVSRAGLQARSKLVEALIADALGEGGASERALLDGVTQAELARDDVLGAELLAELAFVVGVTLRQPADGLRLSELAQAKLSRARLVGRSVDELHASLQNYRGVMFGAAGDTKQAKAAFEEALALRRKLYGPDDPRVASVLNNMGTQARAEGRIDDAIELYETSLKHVEARWGPDHPMTASVLSNLGTTYTTKGELEPAVAFHRRARAAFEGSFGREHPGWIGASVNLADALFQMGRYAESAREAQRALEVDEVVHSLDDDIRRAITETIQAAEAMQAADE